MNLINTVKTSTSLVAVSLTFLSQTIQATPHSSGFQPEIDIQLQYEDNVRRTPEQNKQSDSILVVTPKLPLLWDFGNHKLDLAYNGDYAQYSDQEALNYNDHYLNSNLLLDHSSRLNTEYELGYIREHDIPDDNNVIANLTAEPNQWKENYAKVSLSYGNSSSQGQIITRFEHKKRSYKNNNLRFLDANRTGLSGTFYYRIAPNTRIPFKLGITRYGYQNTIPATDPSSNEYSYLTGLTWDATAQSTGTLQLGLLEKKYDNSQFEDTSIFIIRLDNVWKPNTYTKVVFGAIRDTQESLQAFSRAYIQNRLHTEVSHMVTPRTALLLGIRYTIAKTDDLAAINDDRVNIRLEAKHSLRRWLNIGAAYKYVERDSNLNSLDFKTNIFMLNIQAQFND
ncbi:hypothetical protein MNBD_GAMMA17-1780 [hydrothermal vent metagenome]|uniref:Capsular polysaccharide synthesis enzyme CpsB n=1 Tax=hydrothermal vent metagenome TaxID=652676 RepID=A0A3B0ZUR2_9ZZZZ